MESSYEIATKKIVPVVRGMLILELKNKYHKTEEEIAKKLGITQAAISKRLKTLNDESIKNNEYYEKIDRKMFEDYTRLIAEGNETVEKCICSVCMSLNDFGCKFSSAKKNI
ncbi:MAG: HTH domain-containing protein [Candidatus Micrarchaeaceae archaeon]